jgi:hypothetical protein
MPIIACRGREVPLRPDALWALEYKAYWQIDMMHCFETTGLRR